MTELKVRLQLGVDVPMEFAVEFREYCDRVGVSRAKAVVEAIKLLMSSETEKAE